MLFDTIYLLAGAVLLYLGAEWLVGGAAALARLMGISPLVVGLTVVAYGTSAPELVVSMVAASEGKSALALGNVIGSNVANIGLILGITALIRPPLVSARMIQREVPVLVLAALAIPVVLRDGVIGVGEGLLLLAAALVFTVATVRAARQPAAADRLTTDDGLTADATAEDDARRSAPGRPAMVGKIFIGLTALVVGGNLFVDGASGYARAFGMSERVLGLTIVAVGTSLPELAASVVAALRGHSAIAVGNVVGSNIFNVLLILGATSVVHPIEASLGDLLGDLTALAVGTLALAVLLRGERAISRVEGGLLLAGYVGFVVRLAVM